MAEPTYDPGTVPASRAGGEPVAPGDPLAALRTHVRSAQLAAERLAGEATRVARDAGAGSGAQAAAGAMTGGDTETAADPRPPGTPPHGWDAPPAGGDPQVELRALVELLEALRGLLPPELAEQLNDLIRQLLLLLRAVIDWLVLRLEREVTSAPGAEPIEDIPIS